MIAIVVRGISAEGELVETLIVSHEDRMGLECHLRRTVGSSSRRDGRLKLKLEFYAW